MPERYAAGQVWEYRARAGDEHSLVKIQQVEANPDFAKLGPVYHISVVGFHLVNRRMQPMLPHAPVSRATLDTSVTRLSNERPDFPDAASGITEWRTAHGGVYTISVAMIITLLDRQTAHYGEQDVPSPSPGTS